MTKTNAMRLLDAANIPFTLFEYPSDDPKQTAEDVARHVGLPPEQVFKTLTVRGEKRGILVFCIPANASLNLKKAAAAAGDKKLEMLPQKELLGATGYIHGGCSPIGMKKKYPTYIDETCILFDEITVSAGARGAQLLIGVDALIGYVGAAVADVID
ncbi:MAG: Cys-tRNA(Pro) deacylase [Clostridiaceae bacterium]|nr:Cys-tRNA(Pro) deacylase [Clostridiaceae bacterium]MDY3071817.1 Cys-tRNA(Pro) deacylase [Eubacteriales bacterium]